LRRTEESIVASNENGYLGGMMVSYPFRDIEPSTVNDCFGSRSCENAIADCVMTAAVSSVAAMRPLAVGA
jgi:hypothetical protein